MRRYYRMALHLATMMLIAGAVVVGTHGFDSTMSNDFTKRHPGVVLPNDDMPNKPAFTRADHRAHPNCDANVAHPRAGWRDLLVVDVRNERRRMSMDEASARTGAGVDTWVIGVCY